jgi:hypothetical protein
MKKYEMPTKEAANKIKKNIRSQKKNKQNIKSVV